MERVVERGEEEYDEEYEDEDEDNLDPADEDPGDDELDTDQTPLLDPDLGKDVSMAPLPPVPQVYGSMADDIVQMLPHWHPRNRVFGLYPQKKNDLHGNAIVAVGPPGSGKTSAMVAICYFLNAFVDRAVLVSSTDIRSMQFSELNLFGPECIIRKPTLEWMDAVITGMDIEMLSWRQSHDRGEKYRMRSTMVVFDDVAYAASVFFRRTEEMEQIFSNRRHMAAHVIMGLQKMGQLNKQLRMSVGKYIFTRETNASALAAMWEACFKDSDISPSFFRAIVDAVCINGKRVLVYDNVGTGNLFQWEIPRFKKPVKSPMGNAAWNAVCRKNRIAYSQTRPATQVLDEAVRERMTQPITRSRRK